MVTLDGEQRLLDVETAEVSAHVACMFFLRHHCAFYRPICSVLLGAHQGPGRKIKVCFSQIGESDLPAPRRQFLSYISRRVEERLSARLLTWTMWPNRTVA